MIQEEKDLLVKDLCGRLPYGVKIRVEYPFLEEKDWEPETLYGLDLQRFCIAGTSVRLEEFKPYLFPLSSMTEGQKDIYCYLQDMVIYNSKGFVTDDVMRYIRWCYEKHLDINDLISKGLALDATGLNIYD